MLALIVNTIVILKLLVQFYSFFWMSM